MALGDGTIFTQKISAVILAKKYLEVGKVRVKYVAANFDKILNRGKVRAIHLVKVKVKFLPLGCGEITISG